MVTRCLQSPELDCEVVPERDHVRVVAAGEIDVASTPVLEQTIRELWDAGFDHVILDLRAVEFLDVAGLRVVVDLCAHAMAASSRFELIPGPPQVQRVFELTGTLGVLPFQDRVASRFRR